MEREFRSFVVTRQKQYINWSRRTRRKVAGLQGISVSDSVIILTTAPSADVAHQLAHALVDQRLAACVNVVGPVTSTYRWNDSVQQDSEFQLVVKTARSRIEDVRNAVRRGLPY